MASVTVQEEQSCLICENSRIAVTVPCGHSFCQNCMDHALNQDGSGNYICPECREYFPEIPSLSKNTTVCKTSDHVLRTQLDQEETLTFCTNCIHSLVPAIKTCLLCEAHLCSEHLSVHSKSADHVLSVPTSLLDNIKCSVHNKVLEYYCYEDSVCICVYCAAEEHRSHHLEPIHEASKKQKEKLRKVLNKLTVERKRNDRRVQSLMQQKDEIPSKIANLTEKVNAMFRDIRKQLDDLEHRVHSEISRQEEQVSLSMSVQVHQLEIKNDELSMKMCHIEELCNMNDPLMVLQGSTADWHDTKEGDNDNTKEVDNEDQNAWAVEEFRIALTLYNGLKNLVIKMRKNFYVPELADLLLDLDTAANNVAISSDLKHASWSVISQRRKETPERFQEYQALSIKRFLSGQHYWEVETSESEYWMVGMTYPSTKIKGDQSWIGNNKTSWCICRWFNEYSIRHDSKDIQILSEITCNRYGIYLDYEAGQLSFYELCNPIRHLHTFTTTFTKPLHAAFWVTDNGWIKIRRSE